MTMSPLCSLKADFLTYKPHLLHTFHSGSADPLVGDGQRRKPTLSCIKVNTHTLVVVGTKEEYNNLSQKLQEYCNKMEL